MVAQEIAEKVEIAALLKVHTELLPQWHGGVTRLSLMPASVFDMKRFHTHCSVGLLAIALSLSPGTTYAQSVEQPDPAAAPAPVPVPTPVVADDELTPAPDFVEAPEPAPVVEVEPAAARPAPAAAKPVAGYDKGFFINSADDAFGLKIQERVQGRYVFESVDEGASREEESAFSVARARLTLSGHAFDKDLKYKFQADYGKGNVTLKDFYADKKLGGDVWLRFGQYKRPFSRQQITSSGNLEFVDRAITDKAFGGSRDIGLLVHNNYEKSPELEWAAGVFNGTGDSASLSGTVLVDTVTGKGAITGGSFGNVPTLFMPTLVARVGYNQGGINGYSEADFEGGPLRFGVAASVLSQLDAPNKDKALNRVQADFIVKSEGFSATGGVYASTAQDGPATFSDQSYAAVGFHVQSGYLLQGKYQPVLGFAMVAPDGADNNTMEAIAGFSIYSHKHGFKWQTDVGALLKETTGDATNDIVVRSQVQLSF